MQVAALFATMTLGGLWHGAGLTFVAWGVAHGFVLGAGRALAQGRPLDAEPARLGADASSSWC